MADLPVNPLILIGVGSSFAFSTIFYHLYQDKKKEIQALKKIPVFKPDQQLVKILRASPLKRLQYVAVEGVVQPEGEPLASQFVPRHFGVIQKITVEEHWQFWNSLTRAWNSRTVNRKETNNSVPFYLMSPGAYFTDLYVKVQAPQEASGCFLERVHHRVRRAQEGLMDVMMHGLSGEKPAALEESEELLHVGSTLTGFGEVVLEGGQVMRLQAPRDGRQYLLVPTDYKSFMDRHENSATMWKTLTAVCGLTGASLLAGLIYSLMGRKDDR
ncbi:mitochondrial ubiquitin ligase activator of nfkb 1-A [Genypterus blacodes]|uniref:mitochondrial ubiquitin ligase activator of nfkb 1-A n=1 Tax=Genypterus blacodes TaxID=154954 RepID=UPI003F763FA4